MNGFRFLNEWKLFEIIKEDKRNRVSPIHELCACRGGRQNEKENRLDTVQEKEEEEEEDREASIDTRAKEVQSQLVIAEKGRHIALHTTTHNTLRAFLDSGANSHVFKTKNAFET